MKDNKFVNYFLKELIITFGFGLVYTFFYSLLFYIRNVYVGGIYTFLLFFPFLFYTHFLFALDKKEEKKSWSYLLEKEFYFSFPTCVSVLFFHSFLTFTAPDFLNRFLNVFKYIVFLYFLFYLITFIKNSFDKEERIAQISFFLLLFLFNFLCGICYWCIFLQILLFLFVPLYNKQINKEEKIFFLIDKRKTIAFFLVFLFLDIFSFSKMNWNKNYKIPFIEGHRGYSSIAPENTLTSFQKAKEAGADFIELDVWQTKDNQLVVSHDGNLNRTALLNQTLWDLTYEELKTINVGVYKNMEEHIPLLEEVLNFVKKNHLKVNIELKTKKEGTSFEQEIGSLVYQYHLENKAIITSFNYSYLMTVKELYPNLKIGYTTNELPLDFENYKEVDAFSIHYQGIDESVVKKVHKENKEIFAWTVDQEDIALEMASYGVDHLITNQVLEIQKILHKNYRERICLRMQKDLLFGIL